MSKRTSHAATETRRQYRGWAIAAAVALLASFAAGRLLLPNRNERLLADLPVILHAQALSLVDSPEFLRQLAAKVPADQMTSDEAALELDLATYQTVASPAMDARRRWIENLPTEQKTELATQAKNFEQNYRPPEQERIRALARDLSPSQPDDNLQKTLFVYEQWLAELNPGDIEQLRDDLRDLSPAEQADHVAVVVRREREKASRHLTADEKSNLRAAIQQFVEEKKPDYQRAMQRRREGDRARPMEGLPHLILESQLLNPTTREAARKLLVSVLSPDSQDHWRRLGRRPQEVQAQQLRQWIREAFKPSWGPKELEDFFASNEISNTDRERLLNLPTAEMRAELDQLYLNHEWRGFADFLREPGTRPGERGGFRPDGPPPDRPRPNGPPEEFDKGRFRPGPDERRGPPPEGFRGRRPPPGGPRPGGKPPDGPPPEGPPPPPPEDAQQPI